MRSSTFSTMLPTNEPIQMGIGRCTGSGFTPMRSRWCHCAVEGDQFLRPQQAHDLDLLLEAPTTIREVLIERLVLHPVAPDADAEAQPPAGEQIELGGLLGEQHGLALGADDDRRGELQAGRRPRRETSAAPAARGTATSYVWTFSPGRWRSGWRADDVIVGQHTVESGAFERLRHVFQERRVVADVAGDEHGSESHGPERSKAPGGYRPASERRGALRRCRRNARRARASAGRASTGRPCAGVLVEDASHEDRCRSSPRRARRWRAVRRARARCRCTRRARSRRHPPRSPPARSRRSACSQPSRTTSAPGRRQHPGQRVADQIVHLEHGEHDPHAVEAGRDRVEPLGETRARATPSTVRVGRSRRRRRDRRAVRARPSMFVAGRAAPARRRSTSTPSSTSAASARSRNSIAYAAVDRPEPLESLPVVQVGRVAHLALDARGRADEPRRSPRDSGSVRPRSAAPG